MVEATRPDTGQRARRTHRLAYQASALCASLVVLGGLAFELAGSTGPSSAAAWLPFPQPSLGGTCGSFQPAKARQVAAPAAGARCLLYAHSAPACVFTTKNVAGPCVFNATALGCMYAESTVISFQARPGCPELPAASVIGTAGKPWRRHMQQGATQQQQQRDAGLQAGATAARAAASAEAAQQPVPAARHAAAPPGQQQQRYHPPWVHAYPVGNGSWGEAANSGAPGWRPRTAFFPPEGSPSCPPVVTGAAGLVAWARATGIRRIVLCGDSTMRQLFQRVVTLSRAQPLTVDVVSQRYAHYSLGWALSRSRSSSGEDGSHSSSNGDGGGSSAGRSTGARRLQDSLWMSHDTYPAPLRDNGAAIAARLQAAHWQLAARTGLGAALPTGMASRELTVDLVMGTYTAHQTANLGAYLGDVGPSPQETVIAIHACYWHKDPAKDMKVWPEWVAFLRTLRQHARRVVVLSCPTRPQLPSRAVLDARNADLRLVMEREAGAAAAATRASAASSSPSSAAKPTAGSPAARAGSTREGGAKADAAGALGALQLLDAAAMLSSVPSHATKDEDDAHFQCGTYTSNNGSSGPLANLLHDGHSYRTFEAIECDRGGQCADPVNFALWQALLCLLAS